MAKDDWMFDNTGGELTPKTEEEGVGSKIVGALGRTLESLPDALAEEKPLIGRPLQALFNTDAYQARQAGYQMAKERLADWRAGAELRKKERENALAELDRKAVERGEWYAGAGAREEERKLRESRAKAAQVLIPGDTENALLKQQLTKDQQLDSKYKNDLTQEREATLAQRRLQSFGLTDHQIEKVRSAPPVQAERLAQASLGLKYFQGMLGGNKINRDMIGKLGKQFGLDIQEKDGVPYIVDGKGGMMPATPQTFKEIYTKLQDDYVKEMNARATIDNMCAQGNPAARSISSYMEKIMPLWGNSAYQSLTLLQKYYQEAEENNPASMRAHILNRALTAYNAGEPEATTGLIGCLSQLKQMGISIEEKVDEKTDPRLLHFNLPDGERVDFTGLCEYAKKRDTFGPQMERRIGTMQMAAFRQAMTPKQRMTFDLLNQQGRGTVGKAGKAAGAETQEEQAPQTPREQEHKADIDFGRKFISQSRLTEDANRIWNVISRNPKSQIKSKEQLDACFGNAAMQALYKYRQTNDYDDANAAFIEAMKDYGIPEELIPKHLWAKGKIAQLTAQIKDLGRKREEQMKNPNWTQSSGNMVVPSPRGGGALVPLPSPRDKYVAQRKFLTEQLQKAEAQQRERKKQQSPEARKTRQKEDDAFFKNI